MNKKNIIIWSVFLLVVLISFATIYYFYNKKDYSVDEMINNSIKKRKLSQVEKDQNAYGEAVLSGDESGCQIIVDENTKNLCKSVIDDLKIFNSAMRSNTINDCGQILSNERKEFCKKAISDGMNIGSSTIIAKSDNIYQVASSTGKRTNIVNDPLQKNDCEDKSGMDILNSAIESSDLSFCDCISNNDEYREACKKTTKSSNAYKQALQDKNIELCQQINGVELKKSCTENVTTIIERSVNKLK